MGRRRVRTGEPRWSDRGPEPTTTLLAAFAVAVPLLFYLHQHVEMVQHGYAMDELSATRAELLERRQELVVEKASLSRLERVERAAAKRGLMAPEPTRTWVVGPPDEAVVGEPGQAAQVVIARFARLE